MQTLEDRAEVFGRDGARQRQNGEHLQQHHVVAGGRIEAAEWRCAGPFVQRTAEPGPGLAEDGRKPAQLRNLRERHDAGERDRDQRHDVRLPARQENRADDWQREHDEEGGILQSAGVHPDECDDEEAGDVQRRHHAAALARHRASPERREREVNAPEREQPERGGREVDIEVRQHPGQRRRQQDREDRQQPAIVEQMDARVA